MSIKLSSAVRGKFPYDTCIAVMDFVENYKYIIQGELQAFHWNKKQCTLHSVVLYCFQSGSLNILSIYVISDYTGHDTPFLCHSNVIDKRISYFSDGCLPNTKTVEILLISFSTKGFGLGADWCFFATSHGKSPCDGVEGTVKRVVAQASHQWPLNDQIITFSVFFKFCARKKLNQQG